MDRARVFWSGRSQAVRLPKEYRVESTELRIRKRGSAIILEPVAETWEWLDEVARPLDPDFLAALRERPGLPERSPAEGLFEP